MTTSLNEYGSTRLITALLNYSGLNNNLFTVVGRDDIKINEIISEDNDVDMKMCNENSAIFIAFDLLNSNIISLNLFMRILESLHDINITNVSGKTLLQVVLEAVKAQTIQQKTKIFSSQTVQDPNNPCTNIMDSTICGDGWSGFYGEPPCAFFTGSITPEKVREQKKFALSHTFEKIIDYLVNNDKLQFNLVDDDYKSVYDTIVNYDDYLVCVVKLFMDHCNIDNEKLLLALLKNCCFNDINKLSIITKILKKNISIDEALNYIVQNNKILLLRKLLKVDNPILKDELLGIAENKGFLKCADIIREYPHSKLRIVSLEI